MVDPAQGHEVFQPLVQPADDAAVADADEDAVGRLPVELFADLQRGRLLALAHVRVVAGVAVVPAVGGRGLEAQFKGVVVGALDQHDG